MKYLIHACLIILCCFGCQNAQHKAYQDWKKTTNKVKVLSTTAMIDDLVSQIGKEHVTSLTLIQGDLDPHSYQLVKGDDEKFAIADLVFHNGLGLEHGPSLAYHLHHNEKAIALGDLIQEKNPTLILHYNNQLDPHIWMDISIWAEAIPLIVQALSQKDPLHADSFKENGDQLYQKMLRLHGEIRADMLSIPDELRYLVTSHDAFNYFARAYLAAEHEIANNEWQKRFAAPEGLSPESQLSTHDIREIIDHLDRHKIRVLYPESNVSKASINKIIASGKEIGLSLRIADKPLYSDAMGPPDSSASNYLDMMRYNACTLKQCAVE